MKIALFGNMRKEATPNEVRRIIQLLEAHNVDVFLSEEIRQDSEFRKYSQYTNEEEDIEFALSVGGDGTFLTTAAMIGNRDIPILGINCGHLGFLADVQTTEMEIAVNQLLEGQYTIEQRSLLALTCSNGGNIYFPNALNEIAVMKYGLSSMISIEASINGELLHRYEADGLNISTATGSTAYNLSIGGPLMVPQVRGIILSPIATHSLNVRPIVVPNDWSINLRIKSRTGAYLISVDGRSQVVSDTVMAHIEKAPYTIKLVQVGGGSFIQSLRNKLNWGC